MPPRTRRKTQTEGSGSEYSGASNAGSDTDDQPISSRLRTRPAVSPPPAAPPPTKEKAKQSLLTKKEQRKQRLERHLQKVREKEALRSLATGEPILTGKAKRQRNLAIRLQRKKLQREGEGRGNAMLPLFTCWSCRVKCGDEINLNSHAMSTGHTLRCGTCEAAVGTPTMMGAHLAGVAGHYVRCGKCEEAVQTVQEWRRHILYCSATQKNHSCKGTAPQKTQEKKVLPPFACCVCRVDYENERKLLIHTMTASHYMACGACPFQANTPSGIGTHIKAEEHYISCENCGKRFEALKRWRKHILGCQPEGLFKFACYICKVDFFDELSLELHAQSTGHFLTCAACLAVISTPLRMASHIADCRPEVHYLSCKDCREVFQNVLDWMKHFCDCPGLQKDHSEVIKSGCQHDPAATPSTPELREAAPSEIITPQGSMTLQKTQQKMLPEFACFVCEADHQDESSLMYHAISTAHVLRCGSCSLVVFTPNRMATHIESNIHLMHCEDCKEMFVSVSQWRGHSCFRFGLQEAASESDSEDTSFNSFATEHWFPEPSFIGVPSILCDDLPDDGTFLKRLVERLSRKGPN